jgi:hypothetical protein
MKDTEDTQGLHTDIAGARLKWCKREKKTADLRPFSHGKKRMTINDDALGNKLN